MESVISLHIDARRVAYLHLNRPDKLNAINEQMIRQFREALAEIREKKARVLVLASRGPHFCAGADLTWMQRMIDFTEEENLRDAGELAKLLHELDSLPIPTIARVQGAAYGGGIGFLTCCDIAYASDDSHYCLAEVRHGLAPATISPYLLRSIGERALRRLALSARKLKADDALHLGLVHHLVPEAALDQAIEQEVESLLHNGPQAMATTKALLQHLQNLEPDVARRESARVVAALRVSDEGQEGLSAFFAKRRPNWENSEN